MFHFVNIFVLHQQPSHTSHTLRVWELSPETRKIVATDCNLGQLKRIVHCIQIAPHDDYMFCGTSSGDVLQVCWPVLSLTVCAPTDVYGQVNLSTRLIQFYGPQKNKLSCGVQSLQLLPSGGVLVGSGEGTLTTLLPSLKRTKTTAKVSGSVSSIALSKDSKQVRNSNHIHKSRTFLYLVPCGDWEFPEISGATGGLFSSACLLFSLQCCH